MKTNTGLIKRIFNVHLATLLMDRGCKCLAPELNKDIKGGLVFKFILDEHFTQMLNEIMQDYSKHKKHKR